MTFLQSIPLSKVNIQDHLLSKALLRMDDSLMLKPHFFLSFKIDDYFTRWGFFLKSPLLPTRDPFEFSLISKPPI